MGWWGNASSTFGIGVVGGPYWGVWTYTPGVMIGPRQRFNIGWAEAVAMELRLCMACHHGILSCLLLHVSSVLGQHGYCPHGPKQPVALCCLQCHLLLVGPAWPVAEGGVCAQPHKHHQHSFLRRRAQFRAELAQCNYTD